MTDVWIRTEPTHDDTGYIVTLSVGEDAAVHLTPERALLYASTLLGHVARARHDAAIVRQMRKTLGTDASAMKNIALLIRDIRADRPPLDDTATAPLTFTPGVNQSHKGFISCSHQGETFGTWGLKAATRHALGIIEAVEIANLDAAYLRALVGIVNLERPTAMNVVDNLVNFMEGSNS